MTDEEIRQAYDILMGDGNGAAWQTRVQTDIDPRTGVGVHTRPYEYSPQELQAAMDAGDEDNPWRAGLFNYILQNTGNPRMAVTGTNLAEYAPLVGTALAAKDAEIAVRDLPDAWREGNTADLLGNIAQIGLSGADVALTMAPFAKPIWKGGRNVVRNMGRRGPVPTMYSNPLMRAADDLPAPTNDAEVMAKRVLEMRAAGKAGDVTEEMMAAADPQYMFNNTPLPMDEASRMARAREMGFDTGTPLYHGSGEKFDFFSENKQRDPGFWFTSDIRTANNYVPQGGELYRVYTSPRDTASVSFVEDEYGDLMPQIRGEFSDLEDNIELLKEAQNSRLGTVEFPQGNFSESDFTRVEFDPRNIRRTSARFDPEFRHLRNLSAGVGGLGLGLLSMQPDRAQTEQDTRQYLGGLLQ